MTKTIKHIALAFSISLNGLCAFGQSALDQRIADIRKEFKLINDSNALPLDTINLDVGGEGGEMLLYEDRTADLRKLLITYYGETGKLVEEFYVKQNKLFFTFTQEYHYNRPIYWDEKVAKENGDDQAFDINRSTINEHRFYFDVNEDLLMWVDENKESDFSALQLEEKSQKIKSKLRALEKQTGLNDN